MNYYTLLKSRIKLPKSFSREAIIALLRIIFLDLYNDFENYINHRNNTSTTRKEDLTHRFYTLMMDNYSSLNIQEITIRTKFLNQSALGRFFKRHTNMSPSEYRESTY